MSRGLKDDTTYLVVDIIPFGLPDLAPTPRKKQNLLYSLVLRKSPNSSKGANKLSAVGVVEELFEEGSSMLSKSKLGKDFPLESNYGLFRCAICQVDQLPGEGLSVNSGPFFSPGSKPWEGPFLCASFRRKKDAMEGKRPMMPAATA